MELKKWSRNPQKSRRNKEKTENKKKTTTTTKKLDLSSDISVITLNANGPNKSIKR